MEANGWILLVLGTGLFIAVMMDFATHRMPNWLTLSIAVICLALQFWFGEWSGLLLAAAGLMVGLICFLPSHLFGAMGAGDVKLMAAVGTALGPWPVFVSALLTILAGGAIALMYISIRGGLGALLRRYRSMAELLVRRQPHYLPPVDGEAAALRFPYALAIASGTTMSVWCMSGQCGLTV